MSLNTISNLLKLDMEIKKPFIKKICFKDKELEELYQEKNQVSLINFFASNLIILLGHIATLPYLIFAFYRIVYLILFFIGFTLSLISLIFAFYKKDRKIYLINSHLQIFLVSNFLIVKGFIILGYYHNTQDDNIEEMLRVIIYHFVSTGIFLITNIESNILVYLFYFILNISLIITCELIFIKPRYLFLEGITAFCLFIILFLIRREWDFKLRLLFRQKLKYEKLYSHTYDYVNGLNGLNVSFSNKNLAFYGEKTFNYLNDMEAKEFIREKFEKKNEEIFDIRNLLKNRENLYQTKDMENSLISEFFKNLRIFEFEKINDNIYESNKNQGMINFPKFLIFLLIF